MLQPLVRLCKNDVAIVTTQMDLAIYHLLLGLDVQKQEGFIFTTIYVIVTLYYVQ
jgi:hypothetical protein